MAGIKERIIKEVEKLPEDKIAEVYDFIYLFRIGIWKNRTHPNYALSFFGFPLGGKIGTHPNYALSFFGFPLGLLASGLLSFFSIP